MTRLVVGPFNRVEGDLEVTLDIAGGVVRAAYVNSPMYRGFEQILVGKDPFDALVFAPRICGICSVSQSTAAARALAQAMKIEMPENGELAANLVLATENLADHLSHFYLFFMPDFARDAYAGHPWHAGARTRFAAVKGSATSDALPARAGFLNIMGYLAGKWPHTLAIQPGGSSRSVEEAERIRIFAMLIEFRGFLERRLFGDRLEAITALDSEAALRAWMEGHGSDASDFRRFLEIADDLQLARLGRAEDRFLSFGAYPLAGRPLFQRGVWDGRLRLLDPAQITEDETFAWMGGTGKPLHPSQGITQPNADKGAAYTWCKAPRLAGKTMETGALARQMVDGHPLVRDLVAASGGNVRNRVIARLLEIARVVPAMEQWCRDLKPGKPFCQQGVVPHEGVGMGLTESARGSLGHWLTVSRGRIANYQIVSPTTWNFSPRDAAGTEGPLEKALAGTPVGEGEKVPLAVQHVVRSFDPCMVCTVH